MKNRIYLAGCGLLAVAAIASLSVSGGEPRGDAPTATEAKFATAPPAGDVPAPPVPEAPPAQPVASTAGEQEDLTNWDPRMDPPALPFHQDEAGNYYYVIPSKHIRDGKIVKGQVLAVYRCIEPEDKGGSAPSPSPK
jgi:hypothetical protein